MVCPLRVRSQSVYLSSKKMWPKKLQGGFMKQRHVMCFDKNKGRLVSNERKE